MPAAWFETVRLFTTVRTPSICEASLAAAERSMSLFTAPERVTTPLATFTPSCLLVTAKSDWILDCTSLASCASLLDLEHPATSASSSAANKSQKPALRYAFIHAPCRYVGLFLVSACLDAELPGSGHPSVPHCSQPVS